MWLAGRAELVYHRILRVLVSLSKTNLHFTGPDYDFTFYDIKGSDRPSKPGWVYLNPTTFTIPQYNFRVGYSLTDRLAVSGGIDHLKYVAEGNQMTSIS